MHYFPLCINLEDKPVILIGNGRQIEEKIEKLEPFHARLVFQEDLNSIDPEKKPALVIVGDQPEEKAERIFRICTAAGIPVNTVDIPRLCTFYFPAMINRSYMTIAVTTAGYSPSAATYFRKEIEEHLPDRTEEILDWLKDLRVELRKNYTMKQYRKVLSEITKETFELNRPLSREELQERLCILQNTQ